VTTGEEEIMEINCKHCGVEIPEADINLDRLVAKCAECNAVFSIAAQVDSEPARRFERHEVPMPKGITFKSGMGDLRITYAWFKPSLVIGGTFACLLTNGLAAGFLGWAVSQSQWPGYLCGLPIALVGLGLAYLVIGNCLGRTVIKVDTGGLEARYGPLPPWGYKRVETANIKQLYSKVEIRDSYSKNHIYGVRVVTSDGQDELVVGGFSDPDQALYVEQEIERSLGIKDQPVRGELPR
jgi:hypothetical protein